MLAITVIDENDFLGALEDLSVNPNIFRCPTIDALSAVPKSKKSHWVIDVNLFPSNKSSRYAKISQVCKDAQILVVNSLTEIEMLINVLARSMDDESVAVSRIFMAIREMAARHEHRKSEPQFSILRSETKIMKKTFALADLVAPTNYSVILYGETGTGKEVLAQYIHANSRRRDKSFTAIDCGSISKEIAASELFGHVKGAFTDAGADKKGAFETANGGTLFLDEIGNLSYDVQVLLLRAIQERKIRKVGSNKEIAIDVRIIVASNENLLALSQKSAFREDLYYRLNELLLVVPPLRERKGDLSMFADYFLHQLSESLQKKINGFTIGAWELMESYQWPGNVRELHNVLKKAALLTPEGALIDVAVLPQLISENSEELQTDAQPPIVPVTNDNLKNAISSAEQAAILNALSKSENNKSKASKLLNIHRKTLYNKLKLMKMG